MLHSSELRQKPVGQEEGSYDGYPVLKDQWQKKTAQNREGSGSVTKVFDQPVLFFLKSESATASPPLEHLVGGRGQRLSFSKSCDQDSLCGAHGYFERHRPCQKTERCGHFGEAALSQSAFAALALGRERRNSAMRQMVATIPRLPIVHQGLANWLVLSVAPWGSRPEPVKGNWVMRSIRREAPSPLSGQRCRSPR